MDVRQLNYFVHIAELGSFSKAAAFLSIAQPALSRQVRSLEDELGTRLLYRNGRGVAVTEAGQRILHHAKSILEQMDRARDEIAALEGVPSGTAKLGVPPTVSQVLITPLIKHFREHYPDISLQVIEGFSGHVYEWLVSGRLDVAVLYNAPRTKHLAAERLLTEELFLVSPADAPLGDKIAMADLADLPLILPSRPHGLRVLIDSAAAGAGVALRVDIELDAYPPIKELVEEGAGHTILSFASVYREVAEGRLSARPVVDPQITRSLVLASATQRPLTLAAKTLVEQIKTEVNELVASGRWLGATRDNGGK